MSAEEALKSKMSAEEALNQLRDATDTASLRAAILAASTYNTPAHPDIQAEMNAALSRLSRFTRTDQLTYANNTGPIVPERRPSQDERVRLMLEWRLRRGLGIPVETTEEAMEDICHDTRCKRCSSESQSYQAVCMNFMLECVRVRIMTRMHYDTVNHYTDLPGWDATLTAAMQRFVENPIRFWLDEHPVFYGLGDRLVALHESVVKPTGVDGATKFEARMYGSHAKSIQRVILHIRKCDAAPL
jgi:hypothetical protein